jgi:hypothetical protein
VAVFLSNKSVPAHRKTGLDANRDLNKQEVEFIFHEAAQNLESFHIFKSKIKKSKTYSGLCPFQGLSNGTTLM